MFANQRERRRERRRGAVRFAAAAALFGVLVAALPASGAESPAADPDNLKALESRIGTSIERRKQLDAEAAQIAQEVGRIRAQLVETATRVQTRERDVTESEERLQGLVAAEAVVSARLEKRRAELTETLAALQRLDRRPPPALAVKPDDALGALRSALLLGNVVPELEAEARDLRDRLGELTTLRTEIEQERATLQLATRSLEDEQAEIARLLARKLESQKALAAQARREQETLDRLSREAGNLKELIARLEARAAERLPEARPAPGRTVPVPVAPGGRTRGPQIAALTPPAASLPATGLLFSKARGLLRLPAEGRTVKSFGVSDGLGGRTRGVVVETRPGAQVTAPFDGQLVYAGPFRRYGQLLIISVGEGYHVVLAGMERISGIVGQTLLAGEPVGTMPNSPSGTGVRNADARSRPRPSLYMEFRRNGEPIDPRPWLAASDRKARG